MHKKYFYKAKNMDNNLLTLSKEELIEIIQKQDKEITDLKWKIWKDSHNSSKPSSTDWLKKITKVCNSRKKSWNTQWWILWHKGKKLKRNNQVNQTINVSPVSCEKCSNPLLDPINKKIKSITKQVIDTKELKKDITDFSWETIQCSECKHNNKPLFPDDVTQDVQYGNNIKALTIYMYHYQMLSLTRISELFNELCGIKISETTLCAFSKRSYGKLESFETDLKHSLIDASLLHSDETWVRVSGKTNWIHVASNTTLTYLFLMKNEEKKQWMICEYSQTLYEILFLTVGVVILFSIHTIISFVMLIYFVIFNG